jgi:hypothetical protein
MRKSWYLLALIIAIGLFCASGVEALAAPHYLFSPSTKAVSSGEELELEVKMESGTVNVAGADALVEYDTSRLDFVSVTPVTTPFSYETAAFNAKQPKTNQVYVNMMKPNMEAMLSSTPVSGVVYKIKFRAKSSGTATVKFICTDGMINESNILEMSGQVPEDKISCSENLSGSYEVGAVGGITNPTSTPKATTTTTLPKTGSTGVTVGLMIMGTIGMIGAWFLKAL